jgi:Fe-S-cluster containining protein
MDVEKKCDKCGACCKYFRVSLSTTEDKEDYLLRHGCINRGPKYGIDEFVFPLECAFLNSKGLCNDYEERPEVCKNFMPGGEECMRARKRVGLQPLS